MNHVTMTLPNVLVALPEIFMLFWALLLLLISVFTKAKVYRIYCWAQVGLIIGLAALFIKASPVVTHGFYGQFITDPLATTLKIILLFITLLIFKYSKFYVERNFIYVVGEYYSLHFLSLVGMMVLVSSQSLLVSFLGLELFSLPLYALMGLKRDCYHTTEASLKYFIIGALATGILLYGFSLLYGISHSLMFHDINHIIQHLPFNDYLVSVLSLFLIILGIAFKLGVVPCHMWVPDVYEGGATPVVAFIASVGKVAAFGLLARLLIQLLPNLLFPGSVGQQLLIVIAVMSIAIGNMAAIRQTHIKRLLGYSSIAHMGYMLLGILSGYAEGYAFALFYVVTYAFITVAGFGLILLRESVDPEACQLERFRGLYQVQPAFALGMLIVMFALGGVPPLLGFIAKLAVFTSLIHAHFTILAIVGVVFSAVGIYYTLRVIKPMYLDDPPLFPEDKPLLKTDSPCIEFFLGLHCFFIVGLGLFSNSLLKLCQGLFPS